MGAKESNCLPTTCRPGTVIAVPCFFYSALIVCVFFLLPTSLVSKSTSSESKRYPIINRNDGDSNHQCSLCFHMEVLEVDCFTHRITIISKHYISIWEYVHGNQVVRWRGETRLYISLLNIEMAYIFNRILSTRTHTLIIYNALFVCVLHFGCRARKEKSRRGVILMHCIVSYFSFQFIKMHSNNNKILVI